MSTHQAAAGHAHAPRRLRGLAALLTGVLLALLATPPAPAQPRSSHSQPSLTSAFSKQATSLDPSQVQAQNVCGPVTEGMARCAAHVLHLRSGGAVVRPKMHPQATLGRVRAAHPFPVPGGLARPGATGGAR